MLFQFIQIFLINLQFFIIKSYIIKELNTFRYLNETNLTEDIYLECPSFSDCFNCTKTPYCRWIWKNESCIPYNYYDDENSTIPLLNESYINNDIYKLNDFVNFIRKVCFLPYTSYLENNNSIIYNNISLKYCGQHHITTQLNNYNKEFFIQLKNVSGIYGVPNILCEFVILSGPNYFETNIDINGNETENFYLLYSEDSHNFYDHIKETRTFTISNTGRRANTFIYYGLKSLNSLPFKITFKETIHKTKTSDTTGYVLIALIALIFIILIIAIIYIRNNSILFKKNKNFFSEEEEKIKDKSDYSIKSLVKKEKNSIETNNIQLMKNEESIIKKGPSTPDTLLANNKAKHFSYENLKVRKLSEINEINICNLDNQLIVEKSEVYRAKCGHIYHNQCYELMVQNAMKSGDVKCVSCQQIIYP